ncbi:carbohydrate ABC transporter permease [Georgenia muralis]|uniref:Carbohydrate ABC transporter membrane protein 1 (CUT1 family) n=1 Tax=Georgenia muralis TaxID=154117 RepID=A0A3N4ZMQ4_9MICO|nr:sugar ABC transporter permease [Georgenia muralis]RPF27048.1 carbohydrate ABC transporter membrane protein 1 (CUT1 family) [Georgenia muralis]
MDFFLFSKIGQMILAVLVFAAVVALLMVVARLADKYAGRSRTAWALLVFAGPAALLLGVGLIYPAIRTTTMSFMDNRSENWVGLANYDYVFNNPDSIQSFVNTFWWVFLVPIVSTSVGLLYAILVDGKRFEKQAKSLLFMPMAISFVGAGIIWKFVYEYRGAEQTQIGLLNAILVGLGIEPVRFLQDGPWNTFFLILIMIWIQAGFAMVLLSASIKAIPNDIVEAARLDGVNPWQMFRSITVPSIRPTLVVVLTTISIATLKIFDITRTVTGARFGTQVLANQMYDQSFTFGNNGVGSATAVIIFVLVIPIIVYNVRQMLKNKEVRG